MWLQATAGVHRTSTTWVSGGLVGACIRCHGCWGQGSLPTTLSGLGKTLWDNPRNGGCRALKTTRFSQEVSTTENVLCSGPPFPGQLLSGEAKDQEGARTVG